MIKKIMKLKKSITAKIILLIIISGILINLLVGTFFRYFIYTHTKELVKKNISNYANYIIQDLGNPPDYLKALKISKNLGLIIHFEGKNIHWATEKALPSLKKMATYITDKKSALGLYKHRFFVLAQSKWGTFAFTNKRVISKGGLSFLLVLLIIISVVFVVDYIIVRKMMKPIKLLNKGVSEISHGNFKHLIPTRKKDDLGQLARSFNLMTQKIDKMLLARDQLLLDVSHELRSPITRMKVALEFLEKSKTRTSLNDDLKEMSKMITEILETEKLNYEEGKLLLEEVDLNKLITEIVNTYSSTNPGVKMFSPATPCLTNIDVSRIKIVLNNIIDNALKYSNQNDRPIEINIKQNQEVLVCIQDFGKGIPPDELNLIFEPFYRVDKSRSKDTGGYGLGLNLCKKIMEAHGGKIEVESKLNKGTLVKLIFKTLN